MTEYFELFVLIGLGLGLLLGAAWLLALLLLAAIFRPPF